VVHRGVPEGEQVRDGGGGATRMIRADDGEPHVGGESTTTTGIAVGTSAARVSGVASLSTTTPSTS
jgi:hypothetical protein